MELYCVRESYITFDTETVSSVGEDTDVLIIRRWSSTLIEHPQELRSMAKGLKGASTK